MITTAVRNAVTTEEPTSAVQPGTLRTRRAMKDTSPRTAASSACEATSFIRSDAMSKRSTTRCMEASDRASFSSIREVLSSIRARGSAGTSDLAGTADPIDIAPFAAGALVGDGAGTMISGSVGRREAPVVSGREAVKLSDITLSGSWQFARDVTPSLAFPHPCSCETQMSFAIATAVSAMRFEKPHSLSYQDITRTSVPSMTLVWSMWKVDECGSWLKSIETFGWFV